MFAILDRADGIRAVKIYGTPKLMETESKLIRPKVTKNFCTTAEAADRLGVSIRTVQLWAESGLLQAWKTDGGHRRITLESLERLLAIPKSPALEESRVQSGSAANRLRVLVVEDEPSLLGLYQLYLKRWPMLPEVRVAQDGFEALLKIGEVKPHLLITDLYMPHMNGFEMLTKLRKLPELADMEIIAVTGVDAADIADLPANILRLPKPIPFEELERIATKLALTRNLMPPK
jgi:excisionase family DNA binding protein